MSQVITPALLSGAFQSFKTMFNRGMNNRPAWWNQVAMEAPSDTEEEIYAWMHELPAVRKWEKNTPRKAHRLAASAYRLRNDRYENTVVVERDKVEDDKLGVYMNQFESMGTQVRKFPDREIAKTIRSNGTAWDGLPFFNSAHPVDQYGGSSATYSNDFTGEALTVTNFENAFARFAEIPSTNGEVMALQPNLIIVPPLLRAKAMSILKAGVVAQTQGSGAAAVTNVNQDLVSILVVPELAADPTKWYLAVTNEGVKPLIYQKRSESGLVAMTAENDEHVFNHDEYVYGVKIRGAFGYSMPYLMSRHAA
jgi:phage major head subunit gpT-like protein